MKAGILEELLYANETLVREIGSLQGKVARIGEVKRLPQELYTLPECARLK